MTAVPDQTPLVPGQARVRTLAATLAAASASASAAGITRLADLSGLDQPGLPVFQAVRPNGLCLSVAMGKGLTRRAATVSALLEAIEIDTAERVRPSRSGLAAAALGEDAVRLWHGARRDRLAIRIQPDRERDWMDGVDLATGAPCLVPVELVSLDLTRPAYADTLQTTIGLASGNSRAEARACAVAELVEHDLAAGWREMPPWSKCSCQLDLATVDDPLLGRLLRRIAAVGREVRLWSTGQEDGVAAFLCAISEDAGSDTRLPPVLGSACHPNRTIAALSAVLEAAQSRVAMIAGAREDLTTEDYAGHDARTAEMLLATLSFARGSLAWSKVPTEVDWRPEANLDTLLRVAMARSPLPILAVELDRPHPDLHVVKAVAPGLRVRARKESRPTRPCLGEAAPALRSRRPCHRRRSILFAGPTLAGHPIPYGIVAKPPAVAGDLAALLDDPPEMVGLVDGCFETAPSVWHKEILDLLAHGVAVLGAASLGALRAAELHMLGMTGVGAVFQAYREGLIRRDDAVMVTHAPAALGHRPLTVALVDIEATLYAAPMPAVERRMLQRIARTLPLRARTWANIVGGFVNRCGHPPAVGEAALAAAPSLKRQDALALLAALQTPLALREPPARPPLTSFYRALLAAT